MAKHILCDCKCKFNSTTCDSNQEWNNKTYYCKCKNHRTCQKYYSLNPTTRTCENSKYLKSIDDTSVIEKNEIVPVMDIVSKNMTNTIAGNVSINSDDKEVRYKLSCYILHIVLLLIVLVLIITIICYHYANNRSKQKSTDVLTIEKWNIMNFKKFVLKVARVVILMK